MDIASLLVSQLAALDRRVLPLISVLIIGLAVLCVAALVLGLPADGRPDDPLLGPFRWVPMARDRA